MKKTFFSAAVIVSLILCALPASAQLMDLSPPMSAALNSPNGIVPSDPSVLSAFTNASDSMLTRSTSEGFTMVPAYPNSINPRKVLFEIKPGDSSYDYVFVKNFSSDTVHFSLYGADPTVSNTGSLAYKTRERGMEQAGTWVKFETPEVDLGPQESRLVGIMVNVPANTPLDTYKVGLAMEKSKKDVNNPSVTIATRYIAHAEVKVTEDPQPIPRESKTPPPPKKAEFGTYYFWLSLLLFIISFGLLSWITLHEKKSAKRNRHSHKKKG